jgi:hypothetical protein
MCSCGGDGTDKCDGTDTGQYGTVTMRNGNQPYPQDMLEAALMNAARPPVQNRKKPLPAGGGDYVPPPWLIL